MLTACFVALRRYMRCCLEDAADCSRKWWSLDLQKIDYSLGELSAGRNLSLELMAKTHEICWSRKTESLM